MRHLSRIASTLACLLLVAAALPAADGGRAFTLEDLYRVKGVSSPAISPDGASIVYALTTSDIREAKRTVNLWRVDAEGGEAHQLTRSTASDSSPAFSPDGEALAFISTRSDDAQLWLLPRRGGEPEKKTDFPGGVSHPVWSPDGKTIALTASVWPDCGADADCNRELDQERKDGKLRAHLADGLLFRHWDFWRDGKVSHILLLDLASGTLRDLTPGSFDSPAWVLGGSRGYVFSPDGKELAFTSNHDENPASSTNTDIWTVAVDGAPEALSSPKNLTAGNRGWDGAPQYSPDGRFLAWRTQKTPGYESDLFRLAVLDRVSGNLSLPSGGFDDWITGFEWVQDSKRIVFTADVRGRTPLHEIDVATGAIREISAVGTIDAWAVSPDGTWIVVSRRQVGHPSELYRIALANGQETILTTANADLEAEVDVRPAEEMWVKGADGKDVQVFVVKPHGFDPARKYPLILNIHGGPQQQWTDAFRGDWQVYPGAGYVVAFPNPHGSPGRGQDYVAAISGDWDGKVMEDIARVTDALADLPWIDEERMGAMGWSWGGYAVMWLEGHNQRFKALAAMMGVYDLRTMFSSTEELWFPRWDLGGAPWENEKLYQSASPSEHVEEFKTPCLVISGRQDYRVPYVQSVAFFTDLQERGVPSRLILFDDTGHWPAWNEMALYYAAHLDWFHRWLGGDPSPWDPVEMVRHQSSFVESAE
ncbi:MAG: S9 family peptidase [Acidobacteria bacterium]|nr:S9 family peptidase [Acidobacteriota bacterium]